MGTGLVGRLWVRKDTQEAETRRQASEGDRVHGN